MADFDSSMLAVDQPLPDCAKGSTTNGLNSSNGREWDVSSCLAYYLSHAKS